MKTECKKIHTFECTEVLPHLNNACSTVARVSEHLDNILWVCANKDVDDIRLSKDDVLDLFHAYMMCEELNAYLSNIARALDFVESDE